MMPWASIVERTFAQFSLDDVLNSLLESRLRVYMVGGAVRDAIIAPDRVPTDIDLMTADSLSELAGALGMLGRPRVNRHGNLRYVLPDERHVDVIQTQQFYGGSRNVRRALRYFDASVNALAVPLGTGKILDPLGGARHLAEGRLVLPRARWVTTNPFEDVHVLLRVLRLVDRTGLRVENPHVAIAHRRHFRDVDWADLERLNGFGRQEAEERYSRIFGGAIHLPISQLLTSR
jgi:tRNA nucleotidyltransferase/poly(A) polymerase